MTLLEEIQQRLINLPPEKQSEVLDFIAFLQERARLVVNPEHAKAEKRQRIKSALQNVAELNLFKDVSDPVEWQRQIRKDRPLPGRVS
jgi:hypothetical protein